MNTALHTIAPAAIIALGLGLLAPTDAAATPISGATPLKAAETTVRQDVVKVHDRYWRRGYNRHWRRSPYRYRYGYRHWRPRHYYGYRYPYAYYPYYRRPHAGVFVGVGPFGFGFGVR